MHSNSKKQFTSEHHLKSIQSNGIIVNFFQNKILHLCCIKMNTLEDKK